MAYYRKLVSMQLPVISKVTVEREKEEYERAAAEEAKEAELWEREIKGHIFYSVKEKFY